MEIGQTTGDCNVVFYDHLYGFSQALADSQQASAFQLASTSYDR